MISPAWEQVPRAGMGGDVVQGFQMTEEDKQKVKTAIKEWYDVANSADGAQRAKNFQQMNSYLVKNLQETYRRLKTEYPKAVEGMDFGAFIEKVSRTNSKNVASMFTGVNEETRKQLTGMQKDAIIYGQVIDFMKEKSDLSGDERYKNVWDMTKLYHELGVAGESSQKSMIDEMRTEKKLNAEKKIHNDALDEQEKKVKKTLNAYQKFKKALKEAGIAQADVTSAMQQAMSDSMDVVYSAAEDQFDRQQRAELDSISSAGEAVQNRLDSQMRAAEKRNENRQNALEKRQQARSDRLDREAQRQQDALERRQQIAQDRFGDRQDAEQRRLENRQEERQKRISDFYDARIKKINDAVKAEQNAEEKRQRIFEAEKTRIERLAQIYSSNVDFNVALSSGQMDEAAKIANDIASRQASWNTSDAQGASQTASQKRVDALQTKADQIDAEKSRRLDALKKIEDAEKLSLEKRQRVEKRAFDRRQKLQQRALDNQLKRIQKENDARNDAEKKQLEVQFDRIKKGLDAEKKAQQKTTDNKLKQAQDRQEIEKASLQQDLKALQAFIPRNEKERKQHIKAIERVYAKHGHTLSIEGGRWGKIVGNALTSNVNAARKKLENQAMWAKTGDKAAKALLKGAFNFSPKQFEQFVKTGKLPHRKSIMERFDRNYADKKAAQLNALDSHHEGGVVGQGGRRTGYSGNTQAPSEVTINALKGEGILSLKAMRQPGVADFVDAANKGRIGANNNGGKNIGGPDLMGPAGLLGSMMAGIGKSMINVMTLGYLTQFAQQMAVQNAVDSMSAFPLGNLSGFDAFFAAIAQQESGGNYGAVNGSTGALGKYQILPGNVGPWGRQYLGQNISPNEFLNNPALQDKLARAVLGSYYKSYGPRGAASAWYSGNPNLDMSTASQSGYPSIKSYVDTVMKRMHMLSRGPGTSSGGWLRPASGPITSHYGYRTHPITGQRTLHAGADIGAGMGSPIHAARGGRVSYAGWMSGYGNYTMINHGGGLSTAYGHQSRILVHRGENVRRGETIGRVGSTGNSTGPHLHFEYLKNGHRVNPNLIIPGLKTGGKAIKGGLANLHKEEIVVPQKLSSDFEQGITNLNNGGFGVTMGDVHVYSNGPINTDIDFKKAVKEAWKEIEKEKGPKRRIGK